MLKISRDRAYCDRYRKYKIFIDNAYVGTIKANETCEYIVAPGRHTVYAKIDWCRSNILSIDIGNQDKYVEVGASATGYKILIIYLYITFLKNTYLWLKEK